MHVQSCYFASLELLVFFAILVAVAVVVAEVPFCQNTDLSAVSGLCTPSLFTIQQNRERESCIGRLIILLLFAFKRAIY